MTTLTTLSKNRTVHAMAVGYPGTAKTGSLAALANAGYKLRIIDFDRNIDPLMEHVKPEFKDNVEVAQFTNKLKLQTFSIPAGKGPMKNVQKAVPDGQPTAYTDALRLILNGWKYDDVDLGHVSDWGPDTVLVLDNGTKLGDLLMQQVAWQSNRQGKGPRIQDWGTAQGEQLAFLDALRTAGANCHVFAIFHLKLIEPKFIEDLTDDNAEENLSKTIQDIMEKSVALVPPKLFPSALGRALPRDIGRVFPYILRYETKQVGVRSKRVITLEPSEECDVKCPLSTATLDKLKNLDAETGLLKIFEAITK